MSKQPYRSELGMVSDILQVAMDYGRQGTIITTIARRANLSHYTATDKCQKLIDFGLMESRSDKRSAFFYHHRKRNTFLRRTPKIYRNCTRNKNKILKIASRLYGK